jgi:hypothetical protein
MADPHRKMKEERTESFLSPNSNIAKRPALMFACINIGILAATAWGYSQIGSLLWIIVISGLISLVLFNGLALFM